MGREGKEKGNGIKGKKVMGKKGEGREGEACGEWRRERDG